MRTPLITLLLVAMVPACDDDDGLDDLAALRVVHASPDAPPIDVFVALESTNDPFVEPTSGALITGLVYGQASPYIGVVPGEYTLVVLASGTATVLYQNDLRTDSDDPITAIATGYVGSTASADSFRVITFEESFAGTSPDEARVRVVHASPDVSTIAVDVGDDATIDITTLERFADSGEDGLAVPTSVPLQLAIEDGGARVTAFTTPPLPGEDLFIIAIGNAVDLPRTVTGLSLLVVGPDGVIATIQQNPTVYTLHASPDAPPLDIRNGDTGPLVAGDLAFGELAIAQVPPGDYELSFFPAGMPDATPLDGSPVITLTPGQRYLAIATGMLTAVGNEQRFQLALYTDELALDAVPRIRAIHVSPDAPIVDISTATGNLLNTPPLFPELRFLEASPPEGLLVGASPSLRIGIAPARSRNAVATFELDTVAIGRAFMVAGGALTPAPDEQGFRLFVIDTDTSPWSFSTLLPGP